MLIVISGTSFDIVVRIQSLCSSASNAYSGNYTKTGLPIFKRLLLRQVQKKVATVILPCLKHCYTLKNKDPKNDFFYTEETFWIWKAAFSYNAGTNDYFSINQIISLIFFSG